MARILGRGGIAVVEMLNEIANQRLTQELVNKVLKSNGYKDVRILHLDEMFTSDFVEDRLNIEIDRDNKVQRVWRG